jgi:hypothetical protein
VSVRIRLPFIVALALILLTSPACGGPAAAPTQASPGSQATGDTSGAPARTSKVRGLLDQTLGQGKDYITKVSARLHEVNVSDLVNPPKSAATSAADPAATRRLTETPAAIGTAAPSSSCKLAAQYVADVNLDDQNMTAPPVLQPNQAFTKIWRVKNTGKCPWKPTFRLAYTNGNVQAAKMNGKLQALGQPVNANGTFDIKLNLTAPSQPGVYQGFWQMQDDAGVAFGEPVYVGIRVPGQAGSAPAAPQPVSAPAPGAAPAPAPAIAPTPVPQSALHFSADRTSVKIGEAVVFSWNVQGVYGVYFYEDGQAWKDGGVPGVSSRKVYPPETTAYVLRVLKPDYSVQEQRIQIQVLDAPGVPVIAVFTVNPSQIQPGQCVALNWEVQGEINYIKLYINDEVRLNNAPARGYLSDCPDGTASSVKYRLEAGGPNGVNRRTRQVTISGDPVNGLSIDVFAASSDRIRPGQCVDLTWAISGGRPDTLLLYRNNEQIALDPASSRYTDCPPNGRLVSYELVAGLNLEQVQRLFSVEVAEVPRR